MAKSKSDIQKTLKAIDAAKKACLGPKALSSKKCKEARRKLAKLLHK